MKKTSKQINQTYKSNKKDKLNGFSLLELMLVLGVGTSLLLVAFQLNNTRQQNLAVQDASSQLSKINNSLSSVKKTLTKYTPLISKDGISEASAISLLPKELFTANGTLESAFGSVDIRAVEINHPDDAYAISYSGATANFCANLIAKKYNEFGQVRIGTSVSSTPSDIVWQSGSPFNPDDVALKCSTLSGQKVVQFISDPLKTYVGTEKSVTDLSIPALIPVSFELPTHVPNTTPKKSLDCIKFPEKPGCPGVPIPKPIDVTQVANFAEAQETLINQKIYIAPPGAEKQCSNQSFSWTGEKNCQGAYSKGLINSGSAQYVENTNVGILGGARILCNDGVWILTESTCVEKGCYGAPVSWGGGCTGTSADTLPNSNSTVYATGGWSGSITMTCAMGIWSPQGGDSCSPPPPPPPPAAYEPAYENSQPQLYANWAIDFNNKYELTQATIALYNSSGTEVSRVVVPLSPNGSGSQIKDYLATNNAVSSREAPASTQFDQLIVYHNPAFDTPKK